MHVMCLITLPATLPGTIPRNRDAADIQRVPETNIQTPGIHPPDTDADAQERDSQFKIVPGGPDYPCYALSSVTHCAMKKTSAITVYPRTKGQAGASFRTVSSTVHR